MRNGLADHGVVQC
jgi:acetyl esterase/lipase